jgi:hypothetical protein
VRLRELFIRETAATAQKQLGRAFNHPEHFVFFHGADGAREAIQHYEEVAGEQPGATTVRKKWDGNPQIYWGRENKGGPLILAGHNGWSRGAKGTSPEEIADFIANKSGKPGTPEQTAERQRFAQEFASLHPIFDRATPKDFVGFVYADGLFLKRPPLDKQGVYTFCPNPNSKTCYHVRADSELGQRITNAQVMVVGHAYFPQFGMSDESQKPIDDFSQFNSTSGLIVQGPMYNPTAPAHDVSVLKPLKHYLEKHGPAIDAFLASIPATDKEGIFYKFANQMSRSGQFDNVNNSMFFQWMTNPANKISAKKAQHVQAMAQQHNAALSAIWELMKKLRHVKDQQHSALEAQPKPDIWDTHGEGHVRYADPQKHKYGNIKFVPTSWTPK